MSGRQPSADLVTALESEVMGEAAFRSACYTCLNSDKRAKLRALWDLETQTKHSILAYYAEQGIQLPATGWLAFKSSLLGLLFHLAPWQKLVSTFLDETDKFLVVFRRLEEQASEADKPLFKAVVDHELAIQQFAELEAAGRGDESIAPVLALLQTPAQGAAL